MVPFQRAAAAAVLLLGALAGAAGAATPAAPAGPAGRRPPPAAKGPTLPVEESLSERRAVRGSPVDDASAAPESPELREVRRFEEQAFPRSGFVVPAPSQNGDGVTPLPGHWGGSGDVPPELRTEARPARPAAEPAPPDSEWLRALTLPDLPVRWDPLVLRYLDYFKNDPKGHAIMGNWLRRAGRFRALFEKTLERQGLPKSLLYVAMVESGFDTGARSRVGAGGVWQFMPGAGRAYGLEVSYWLDARSDPEKSAEAAARYLKDLYVRFGSWPLVFAAYNAGYGAVLKSITAYNTNDFWELVRHEAGLPWESSIYVPKIMAAAIVGTNAQAFGFDVTPDAPYSYETAEAPPGTALATVARAAGASLEVLEALNPELVRDRTPPDRGPSRVRLPAGAAATFAANLEAARGNERTETIVLRFGETLEDVARARGTNARELRRLNGVKDSSEVRAGVSILVPKKGGAPKTKPPGKGEGAGEAVADAGKTTGPPEAADADDEMTIVAVPDRSFAYEGRERVFYKTRDGDGLEEIAETFGVRAAELTEWNNLDATAKLHPRMVLQVFVRKEFDPVGVMLLDPAKVRVVTLGSEEFLELETARKGKKRLTVTAKGGDTLAKLGRRYGLTPGDLARINRFSYNTELHEGQRIVVYSPTGEPPREVAMGLTPEPKRPKGGAIGSGANQANKAPGKPTTAAKVGGKPITGGKPAAPAKPVAGGKPAAAVKPGQPPKAPLVAPKAPGLAPKAPVAHPTAAKPAAPAKK